MTPEDALSDEQRERLAKTRFQILWLIQFAGFLVMILGLWIWAGDILREGGWAAVGVPLFVLGAIESLLLPKYLARRWRSPRGS